MCGTNCGCCGKGHMCGTSLTIKTLVIIGGVNWGLVGIGMLMDSNLNVVNMLLGSMPTVEAVVYIVVGIAAVMKIFGCKCKTCRGVCTPEEAPKMEGNM